MRVEDEPVKVLGQLLVWLESRTVNLCLFYNRNSEKRCKIGNCIGKLSVIPRPWISHQTNDDCNDSAILDDSGAAT